MIKRKMSESVFLFIMILFKKKKTSDLYIKNKYQRSRFSVRTSSCDPDTGEEMPIVLLTTKD